MQFRNLPATQIKHSNIHFVILYHLYPKIRLSIEEVVENIVQYAYEDGAGSMDVQISKEDADFMLTIKLTDQGVPFNPLEMPDPDLSLSAEDRQIGGLGIFLCKQMMDEVSYSYENGCNVLTMCKKVVAWYINNRIKH